MGFWDFIAPDFEGFADAVGPWVPANLIVGDLVLDRANLVRLAYYNPASAAGLASRIAYQFSKQSGAVPQDSWNSCQAMTDNLNRGGEITPGPAFAGSDLTKGYAMAPLVIPNTYETTVKMLCGGRTVDNVFFNTSSTGGQEATVAAAFLAAWKNATSGPLKYANTAVSMVSVTTVDIRSSTGGQFTVFDTSPGLQAGSIASRAASALLQYNGNLRSRSTRGRTYFGPLTQAQVNTDGATLNSTFQTNIVAAFNYLFTQMSTAGFPAVVASRKNLSTTPITLVRVSPTMATQRHRLRG